VFVFLENKYQGVITEEANVARHYSNGITVTVDFNFSAI
jgi:hypothetical protein